MQGRGPATNPPRASTTKANSGTAETRSFIRNITYPLVTENAHDGLYGLRNLNNTRYRRVDGRLSVAGRSRTRDLERTVADFCRAECSSVQAARLTSSARA